MGRPRDHQDAVRCPTCGALSERPLSLCSAVERVTASDESDGVPSLALWPADAHWERTQGGAHAQSSIRLTRRDCPAGTLILVGSGSDTHPSDASRRCDSTGCGRACHLVVGSSAGRRDRGCDLVLFTQADELIGRRTDHEQDAAEPHLEGCELGLEGNADKT